MKQIDEYIDSLYKGLFHSPEVADLKAEMRSHLQDSVAELRAEGKTEEESLRIAIERFGEPNKLLSELGELYQIRKTFSKWVLKIGAVFGVLGLLIVISYFAWNKGLYSVHAEQLYDKVIDAVEMGEYNATIGASLKEQVKELVDSDPTFIAGGVKIVTNGNQTWDDKFQFIYPGPEHLNAQGELIGDYGDFRYTLFTGAHIPVPGTDKAISIQFTQWLFTTAYLVLGYGLLFGYWCLFSVWALMNMYYSRNGNVFWAVLIAVLNLLGYWIYQRMNKQPQTVM